MKPTLLVLAAGMGSRYGGLKQLDTIGPSGETIIDYSLFDAIKAGFGKVVFVIRKSFEEEFKAMFLPKLEGKIDVELAYQEIDNLPQGFSKPGNREKPWGTGHAIWVAKNNINEPFAMINADDYYGCEAFFIMAKHLSSVAEGENGAYSMCGYQLANTLSENGSVSRGVCNVNAQGFLQEVQEHTKIYFGQDGSIISEEGSNSKTLDPQTIVSMNLWGFTPDIFTNLDEKLKIFLKEKGQELKSELYIPFVVDELMKEQKVETKVFLTGDKWFGVTYKEDKELAIASINKLVNQEIYPSSLWE
jgi:hypothetical protein